MSCNHKENQEKPCWNYMEQLKHLICAIDCHKCPKVPEQRACCVVLPPRIRELSPIRPKQSTPCCPRRCQGPIVPGPCCPSPLPPPRPKCPRVTATKAKPCLPCSPLPCYPSPFC